MGNQTQAQESEIVVLRQKPFIAKSFPRNLEVVELLNAVTRYRQAVQPTESTSGKMEVSSGC